MKKKTFNVDSFRKTFADASENFTMTRVVADDEQPLAPHRDKNLATRARISAKFSALEEVDVRYLSERMDQASLDAIPELPVKLQDRILDASRFLQGTGKNSILLLKTVLGAINSKGNVPFTALVGSVKTACSYTPATANSRTRNAVNSLVALGVVESSGNGFSTKNAAYSIADNAVAKDAIAAL